MFGTTLADLSGVVMNAAVVGFVYPLVYAAPWLSSLHLGYSIVAAWVFQPSIAPVANSAGVLGEEDDGPSATPGDD